ncbi:MAG: hypothetical protein V4479_03480 [Actinomycetota bacterium]
MTTRWARFLRGWIAAAVSVFVALCSHTFAGGAVPSPAGVALCLAFAGMACLALAGKTLSLPRLALSVTFSQFIFHGAFSLLGSAPAATTNGSMAGGMEVHALHLQAQADAGMAMPTWMWGAHTVAAVVTIAALRYGERAFWAVLALARPFMLRMLAAVARAETPARPGPVNPAPRLLRSRLIVSSRSLRGPPVAAAL